TAVGSYPEQAVKEMHQIALATEASLKYEELLRIRSILPHETISGSVAFATRELAQLTKASTIMAFTLSGNTARIISKYRPRSRIIAVTPNYSVAKQLLLYWGVEVMVIDRVPNIEKYFEYFLQQAIRKNLISKGELVVLTSGIKKESDKPSGSIKLLST
ncbi:MAG: pyruvate kinase alpha/beta domain-containing protein, partial [bacterium]